MSFFPNCIIDIYGSKVSAGNFTWVKRAGLKYVRVSLIGAGAGGTGGGLAAPGITQLGGNGGGGAPMSTFEAPADVLGATETVQVGIGLPGTAGATVPGAALDPVETNAQISLFGGWMLCTAGKTSGITTGSRGLLSLNPAVNSRGQDFSTGAANQGATTANMTSSIAAGSSPAGAEVTLGVTAHRGNAGGASGGVLFINSIMGRTNVSIGGIGGLINGNAGDGHDAPAGIVLGGGAGGSGGSSVIGNGGTGGNGGFPGGAGGGGGAALQGTGLPGKGGDGANGLVIVYNFFN